jgi:hypothetical protein
MYMTLQSVLGGGEPPPDDIHSIFTSTLNMDISGTKTTSEQIAYNNALQARWSGKYLIGFREDLSAVVDYPNAWTPRAWQRDLFTIPILQDKSIILHTFAGNANGKPGGDTPLIAEAADHSAWIKNMRWAIYNKLKFYGDKAKIVLSNNEPDNIDIGSSKGSLNAYDVMIEDLPTTVRRTSDAIRLQRKRIIMQCKAVWEQMHGIDQDPDMQAPPHPGHFFGPTVAFPNRQVTDPNQIWHLDEIFSEGNGEILSYLDGVTVHNHRVHSRIETYANQPPSLGGHSMYHAWKAIETANALRTPADRKRLPVMTDEAGINYDSANGTWNGGTVIIPATTTSPAGTSHNFELRKYRAGQQLMSFCWYGVMLVTHYVQTYTGHPTFNLWSPDPNNIWEVADGGDGFGFKPYPDWQDTQNIWDHRHYDIQSYQPVFPAKTWEQYHLPYTWGVYIDQAVAPTGTPLTTPPYNPWNNVTFAADGVVTMTAGNGAARNLIMRPVWLRRVTRTHRFQVKVNFPTSNASAKAKIRVRGHNKLDGLENLEVEVVGNDAEATGSNWKTIAIDFNHTGHGLQHLNPANYALLCCDHNAVGTVRFKDPEILVA